jgi:catechol 2,3-dioxygenase-like lactoylglutathione lyase family enzyme
MPVTQLIGLDITVSDLPGMTAFYRDRLGLDVGPEQALAGPAWSTLLGLDASTTARAVDVAFRPPAMRLQLVAFDPPGQAYPRERASNDQWFQHLALVTSDMQPVWQRLRDGASGEITTGEPVRLPPNTGSVTAFKLRDPEGHPLELISFPHGLGDPVWQVPGDGILGVDHTAISVMDVERSIAFYRGLLGFSVGGRSLNAGTEQDRLDGLMGCEVDVVALQPTVAATPHVELLHYRTPPGHSLTRQLKANDVASGRMVHAVDDIDGLIARLVAANVSFVSPGIVTLQDGALAATVRDPDGHMIALIG